MTVAQKSHLTFKANMGVSRHGWLRLTPAYSYRLVADSLRDVSRTATALDPFAGTGTTGLVAAELGLNAEMLDINPFLVWFGNAKCRNYSEDDIADARKLSLEAVRAARSCEIYDDAPVPPMHRIERWWDCDTLRGLALLNKTLNESSEGSPASDLISIAFCRVMISMSNAAFNHQSMSFRHSPDSQRNPLMTERSADEVFQRFESEVESILDSALGQLPGSVNMNKDDARFMESVESDSIDFLCTSPPYCNRISYIRELRPYMYWLGYLSNGKQAGDMDWDAIGGTWGSATSRLSGWDATMPLPLGDEFGSAIDGIANSDGANARIMANYVHKYFFDMYSHFREARRVVKPGGRLVYIVGNSTFYGNTVHTERWYAGLMENAGFENVSVTAIRKRNSNKKLYEYSVECVCP